MADVNYIEVNNFDDIRRRHLRNRTVLTIKNPVFYVDTMEFFFDNRSNLLEVHLSPEGNLCSSPDGKFIFERYGGKVVLHVFLSEETIYDRIEIPDGVTIIGDSAFENCAVKEIVMPDTVLHVYLYAFCRNSTLESVKFSSNLSMISSNAFFGCTNLKSVCLPDSMLSLR